MHRLPFPRFEKEAQAVDALPHFVGDLITDSPGIFARRTNAVQDAVWILGTERKEVGGQITLDFRMKGVVLLFISGGHQQRTPKLGRIRSFRSGIEKQILCGKEQAREVFSALHVARHPVDAVGDAA